MNHGTHTHWLRRTTTIAILAAAIAAPAAHAHPAYTGDVVSRYLASHPAGSSDVIDRYLISHTPTNVQAPNPVSDVLNTLQVNRNQQIATQNPVSDVRNTLQVNRNQQIAAQNPVSDVRNTLQVNRNQQIAARNPVSDIADSLQVNRNSSRLVAQAPLTSNPAASVSRSFSWRDAGIGASAAVVLILLLTAALQLTHRRRNRLAY